MEEIIAELEAMGNYIPPSEATLREYRNILIEEHRKFVETHDKEKSNANLSSGKG